jgi:hypothetical protein
VWESKAGASTKALLGVVVEEAKSLAAFTLSVLCQLARKKELSTIERRVSMVKCEDEGINRSDNHRWEQRRERRREECHLRCLDIVSLKSSLLHLLAEVASKLCDTSADVCM